MTASSNEKKQKAEEKPSAPMKPPMVWGAELMTKKMGKGQLEKSVRDPLFAAAAVMMGWEQQTHHYGEDSFKLTEEDFRKAVESCAAYPAKPLHQAGIPPVSKQKLSKAKKAR